MDDSIKPASVTEEAARWFVRLKDDDLTAAERREYLSWLKQGPVHVAEMLRIGGVYGAVRAAGLKSAVSFDAVAEDDAAEVIELAADSSAALVRKGLTARTSSRGGSWAGSGVHKKPAWAMTAIAASLLFVVVALSTMIFGPDATLETAAGEWRHLSLEDGSFVRLGPRTRLRVSMDRTRRALELQQGEATFQVARDTERAFVVNAGLAQVRALGTAFGVTRASDKVVVTVAEGSVSVAAKGSAAGTTLDSRPLLAGEQIAVSRAHTSAVQHVDVSRELAWAEGRLIFDSQTLAQAVDEFNRRNHAQITIEDPALASRPVRGVFDAADPESFVDFLVTAAQVEAERGAGPRWVLKQNKGDGVPR